MKANTVVKIAMVLVGCTVLFYWQEVWAWVSAKSVSELTGDILGFVLKWFFLAMFAFLAVQIPHYVSPWLKLARVNSRRKLKEARRGRVAAPTAPKTPNVNRQLLQMLMQQNKPLPSPPQSGEGADEQIHLRF